MKKSVVLLMSMLLLVAMGCDRNKKTFSSEKKAPEKAQQVPPKKDAPGAAKATPDAKKASAVDYSKMTSLGMSSGGGFTGMYEGIDVSRSGKAALWEGMSGGKAPKKTFDISKERAEKLFALAQEAKLGETKYKRVGNMNYSLKLKGKGYSHTITWCGAPPSEKLGKLYHLLAKLEGELRARARAQKK